MDHGELNILGRTSGINAELDRFKASQAKAAKVKAKQATADIAELRARAKLILAGLPEGKVLTMACQAGITEAQARQKLNSMAHWEPARVIKVLG